MGFSPLPDRNTHPQNQFLHNRSPCIHVRHSELGSIILNIIRNLVRCVRSTTQVQGATGPWTATVELLFLDLDPDLQVSPLSLQHLDFIHGLEYGEGSRSVHPLHTLLRQVLCMFHLTDF